MFIRRNSKENYFLYLLRYCVWLQESDLLSAPGTNVVMGIQKKKKKKDENNEMDSINQLVQSRLR